MWEWLIILYFLGVIVSVVDYFRTTPYAQEKLAKADLLWKVLMIVAVFIAGTILMPFMLIGVLISHSRN